MNSKEALRELEIATNWSSDEDIDKDLYNLWGNVACRTIKKDLKILEILKEYIKISDCKFEKADRAGQCILMFIPDFVDDYRVIKEWLDNE